MRCTCLVVSFVLVAAWVLSMAHAADPIKPDKQEPKQLEQPQASENDALSLAAADLKTLDRESQFYQRYLWVTTAEQEDAQAMSFVANLLSQAISVYKALVLGKDRLMLVRIDLRNFWPKEQDLARVLKVWENFAFDENFNLLLTKDTLRFAEGITIPKQIRTVKRKVKKQVQEKDDKGRLLFYNGDKSRPVMIEAEVEVDEVIQTNELSKGVNVLRVVGAHLDPKLVEYLVQATQSQAPVTTFSYFVFRSLSAIQEDGLFKDLWGGLYYDFAGIPESNKKGITDEDLLFDLLGVGDSSKGITAESVYDKTGGDKRVAMFRSKVTGKARLFEMLRVQGANLDESQGILGISHDPEDKDVDIGRHPVFNLATKVKDRAREVIFEGKNGFHKFAAYNGEGKRQNEVPFNVANDSTIPTPYTQRLQPGIGCMRCHGPDDGWKPAPNDVATILKNFDVLTDLSENKKSQFEILDRIRGQYNGNFELKLFPRGRADYANVTLKATGPWKKSKDQTDVVRLSSARVSEIYRKYWYTTISAREALRDIGVVIDAKDDAAAKLRSLISGPPGSLEDVRIAALLSGLSLTRVDWALVRSFVLLRLKVKPN